MTRSVKGKSAIVTGGGSRINFAFARLLLEHGCNVMIGDLTLRPEAETLVEQYSKIAVGGILPKVLFQKTDVSSWMDLNSLFTSAEKEFGSFDIVCPGAGIFEPAFSGFWNPPGSERSKDDPEGDRFKSIDVNLVHPIRATQLAVSHFMLPSKPASQDNKKTIVHTASVASEMAFIPAPFYNASKWGLRGFIYSMAELEEWKHIRVAGVAPATVRTNIWFGDDEKRKMVFDSEGKEQLEWVTPEEVAEVMLKICTDDEVANSKGEAISLKGGSLIEVLHGDVRDLPMYGAAPPGTNTDMKGLTVANYRVAWEDMYAAAAKPGWGRV